MKLSRRRFVVRTALAAFGAHSVKGFSEASTTLPWRNWSGALTSYPASRFAPSSEDELVSFLRTTSDAVRPVGAGHSFTPLVPTDGVLVVLDKLSGLFDYDEGTDQATFGAGTRLGSMGVPLDAIGQAMFNLPDIDRQTLAGAISTATSRPRRHLPGPRTYRGVS